MNIKPWYIDKGPDSDVVISTRIRLARNFKDYPFPYKLKSEQRQEIRNRVETAAGEIENRTGKKLSFVDIGQLDVIDRAAMVEKRLISRDLAENRYEGSVLISEDETLSIMVNEEDHIRIQCLSSGTQLEDSWRICNAVDDALESRIEFAYDEDFGYLTCCPTNLGTAVRISAMLHLPALAFIGHLKVILDACSKLGITVRGLYGENSEALGNMLQLSNQLTLGHSEEEIKNSVSNIVLQIIEHERKMRAEIFNQNPYSFEDRIFRSYGVLSNARIISTEESMKLLSDVRLGVDMGIIKDIKIETINEITLSLQPANLQKVYGKLTSPEERDIKRAELIRSIFCPRNH